MREFEGTENHFLKNQKHWQPWDLSVTRPFQNQGHFYQKALKQCLWSVSENRRKHVRAFQQQASSLIPHRLSFIIQVSEKITRNEAKHHNSHISLPRWGRIYRDLSFKICLRAWFWRIMSSILFIDLMYSDEEMAFVTITYKENRKKERYPLSVTEVQRTSVLPGE